MIKNIIFYFIFFLIILFSAFTWPYFSLPFKDDLGIISQYTKNNYNSYNDLLRYLVFVFIPVFLFFVFFVRKKNYKLFLDCLNFEKKNNLIHQKINYFILFSLISISLVEFFSIEFPIQEIDSFHEGQKMSAAFKFTKLGTLWSGSFVTVGIIYEVVASYFIWDLFDIQSIGLSRFVDLFLKLVLKILLILFIFQISKTINLKNYLRLIFLILNSFLVTNMIGYHSPVSPLLYREIPVILSLLIFFQYIIKQDLFSKISIIFFGPLSCLSIFLSVDRGIITNLIIFSIIVFLLINKEFKTVLIIIFSIILSWTFSALFLGNEFEFFLENTKIMLNEINQIGGIIHPIPFSGEKNASRATKSLFLIAVSIIISLDLCFRKSNNLFSKNLKIIILFLSISGFLSYGYALGRSDGPHIKSSIGYNLIFFCILFSYSILKIFDTKILFKIESHKTLVNSIFFIFLTIFLFNHLKFYNLTNYKTRFYTYINHQDEHYINDQDKLFVKDSKELLENYDCVQLFSNDVLILYLLRKSNCTKFYFPITIGSVKNQKILLEDLDSIDIIIADYDEGHFSPYYRLPIVREYISLNYETLYDDGNWKILNRIKN